MPFSWGSLGVLLGFSLGSHGVLMGFSWYKYFISRGSHFKLRLTNLFLLGFSWGSLEVLLGFSLLANPVLDSKLGGHLFVHRLVTNVLLRTNTSYN